MVTIIYDICEKSKKRQIGMIHQKVFFENTMLNDCWHDIGHQIES